MSSLNNGKGVVGVNWNVKLISLRTMNEDGVGTTGWMIEGVEYLIGLLRGQPTLKLASLNASLGWYAPVLKPGEQGRDVMWQVLKALDSTNRVVFVESDTHKTTLLSWAGSPGLFFCRMHRQLETTEIRLLPIGAEAAVGVWHDRGVCETVTPRFQSGKDFPTWDRGK